MLISYVLRLGVVVVPVLALGSCASSPKPQWLMPTPAVYLSGEVKPFVHLPEEKRSTQTEIFFATNRKHQGGFYSGAIDEQMRFGTAQMALGPEEETWERLVEASTTHPRPSPMEVRVIGSQEDALAGGPGEVRWVNRVNRAIASTPTRDVVIYVHGAKVGFENSCAFAAELKHFSGRDLTAIAFDWPTHRELLSYVDGVDVSHARKSSTQLARLIKLLSSETLVRRIHIVSWSAGARVLSRALDELGGSNPRERASAFRLGAVIFAAGDVPERDFEQRLPSIHGLSERVIVYVSDDDFALRWSSRLMGGGRRLGVEWDKYGPEQIEFLRAHPRLEVVDTSYGKNRRGFDIRGHRYWFQHPWVNSDLLLAIRTDQPATRRGLSKGDSTGFYYFASDYDTRIGGVGRRLSGGSW